MRDWSADPYLKGCPRTAAHTREARARTRDRRATVSRNQSSLKAVLCTARSRRSASPSKYRPQVRRLTRAACAI
eukprot:IDg17881t1